MKALLSIMFLFVLTFQSLQYNQETETLEATFVEYADDTYYFTDKDDDSHEFQQINKSVLDTYYLKDDLYKGKNFVITYKTETEQDEEGDDFFVDIITGLELKE